METITIPDTIAKRAMQHTGKRTPRAALMALVEKHTEPSELPISQLPKAVQQSERELRQGKGKRFKTAAAALRWLES